MKSQSIQHVISGKSLKKGTIQNVTKLSRPDHITVCHNSANLDESFRKGRTFHVETFPDGKSGKDLTRSSSTPGTGRPNHFIKSTGNVECPDNCFRIALQQKHQESRSRNLSSHSFGTPSINNTGIAEWPGHSYRIPQVALTINYKRSNGHSVNVVATKKRHTDPQTSARPSQPTGHKQHVYVKRSRRRRTVVHVRAGGAFKDDYKPRRVVSVAHGLSEDSEPTNLKDIISKNDRGAGPTPRSKYKQSSREMILEASTQDQEGQFRLSLVSDISDASGLSDLENYEFDNEDGTSYDILRGNHPTAGQLRYSTISLPLDVSEDFESEDRARAQFRRQPFKPHQASSRFLAMEPTAMRSDLYARNSFLKYSFQSANSSKSSVFSEDFTLTGVCLDNSSYASNYGSDQYENNLRMCRDRTNKYSILSANESVSFSGTVVERKYESFSSLSSELPQDDSTASVCGSAISSHDSASYVIRTKEPMHESMKQHPRRSSSKTLLKAMAAMFKKAKPTVAESLGSECDLIVDFYSYNNHGKNVVKRRNSKGFASDFSAWEKRRK